MSPTRLGNETVWTLKDIADAIGVTRQQIGRYVLAGKLRAIRPERDWLVTDDEAQWFIEQYRRGNI